MLHAFSTNLVKVKKIWYVVSHNDLSGTGTEGVALALVFHANANMTAIVEKTKTASTNNATNVLGLLSALLTVDFCTWTLTMTTESKEVQYASGTNRNPSGVCCCPAQLRMQGMEHADSESTPGWPPAPPPTSSLYSSNWSAMGRGPRQTTDSDRPERTSPPLSSRNTRRSTASRSTMNGVLRRSDTRHADPATAKQRTTQSRKKACASWMWS